MPGGLRKASTPKAALKRQFVLDKVLAGQVVCVQETHWSEAQGYAWAGLFPASQVAFTHAHTDPCGVTRGGVVAVLVPHRTRITSQRVLAPGSPASCAEHVRQCARMSEVSLAKRGPSSKRPAVAERYRVGKAVHKT